MKELSRLPEALAQILHETRKNAGLTQEELARSVGCARSFIAAMEGCVNLPGLNAFIILCNSLDIPPAEMLVRVLNRMEFLEQERESGDNRFG